MLVWQAMKYGSSEEGNGSRNLALAAIIDGTGREK